jgi:photosystem II stability/assembly factor-like uncharacterized protein
VLRACPEPNPKMACEVIAFASCVLVCGVDSHSIAWAALIHCASVAACAERARAACSCSPLSWSGDVGYLVGSYGLIVKTTDGGINWTQQSNFQYPYSDLSSEINTISLNSIAVRPPSRAHPHSYALPRFVGYTMRLTTKLSRLPWTVLPRRVLTAHLRGGRAQAAPGATASTQLWVVGDKGLIMMTADGGTSWDQQNSGVTQRLNDVAFSSATNGYAVGNGGTILKTTDGGGTWVNQRSGPPATPPYALTPL